MAGFKTQIKARFKAKFPKVNLSAAKLDAIIARVDAKTEADDDEAIDASLDAINEFTPFEEMAREEDRIRSLEAKTKPKVETTEVEKPETKTDDDVPAWAKGLTDTIQTLSSKLTALEGEKTTTSRKQQLTEKLKDAPESYKKTVLKAFDRMKFDTEEAFTEYLTEAETDATAFIQEQSDAGLGKDRPSNSTGGNLSGKASEAELDAALANFKI